MSSVVHHVTGFVDAQDTITVAERTNGGWPIIIQLGGGSSSIDLLLDLDSAIRLRDAITDALPAALAAQEGAPQRVHAG